MANKTTNLGLTKPTPEEFYDVGVQNNNMDIIDEQIGLLQEQLDVKQTSIHVYSTDALIVPLTLNHNNTEWRYTTNLESIEFETDSNSQFQSDSEYHMTIVFKSGATPTTITNTAGVYFTGDECDSGVFTPVANKIYEMGIWWNGFNFQGVVRGV